MHCIDLHLCQTTKLLLSLFLARYFFKRSSSINYPSTNTFTAVHDNNSSSSRHQGDRRNNILCRRKLLTMTQIPHVRKKRTVSKKKNRPQKENHLHIEVCSCQSSRLQTHICSARQKDALVVLEGGDSGPLELPAAPGLMTVVDLALYRSLEGELTPTRHVRCSPCGSMSKSKPKPSLRFFSIVCLLWWRTIRRPPSMADRPSANDGILFTKSVAASLPHSRFSWFSCCFRVVHLVMQGKDAD